jgi:hypothetical protein
LISSRPESGWRQRLASSAGLVTAEFAVLMPALVLVLLALIAMFRLALTELALAELAVDLARGLARGETPAWAVGLVELRLPGAQLRQFERDGLLCAELSLGLGQPRESCAVGY